ncbi:hypothetical protein [Bradyrhizobium phage BDU-MI-1]|nr:hypothetical protein [Bradyrhizobium phage BDU-MI-1]
MADNNLNLNAVFTGQDKSMSSTVMKLKAQLKSLDDQMKKFGDKSRKAIVDIPMENYVKQINQGQKALNGLTKKHYDWAKANGVAGKNATAVWTQLTTQLKNAAKEHEKLSQIGGRKHAKRIKELDAEIKAHYKNAVAYKYLYNKVGEQRNELERRMSLKRGEIAAAELRAQERAHGRHLTRLGRMHRDAMRSMEQMSRLGSRALPYAAAGAAASGYAGVSAFKTRMRIDTAETNLSMFGEIARSEVAKMRKEWLNSMGIKYGAKPDEMLNSATEVRKAGVPMEQVRGITDIIMKSAAGLDLDIKNTTRYATRIATLTGDMKNLDPERIKSMLNAVAVAGIESAADANEIIAANRRASGVFSSTKMKAEDLNAFTGTGISIDLPSQKVGTFIGFLAQELVNSKFETGKRAEDLSKGARELGFGSRANMSAQMAANPADTMLKIFEKMGNMPEQKRAMVADLIGMREWRDELGAFIVARDDVRRLLEAIRDKKNANRLDDVSDAKLKSLAMRWKSFVSALTLVWESVGAGLEKAFGQISAFFTDYLGKFDTKKISDTVEAITDGFVQGIGYNSWTDMLQAAFGDPANAKSWAKETGDFVRGFVREMSRMVTIIKEMAKGVLKAFGGTDAETMGKATAHLIELVIALKAVGTVASVLADIITFVKGIAAVAMLGPTVWSAVAGLVSGMLGGYWLNKDKGLPDLSRKSGESKSDHQKRIDEWSREQLLKKSSYTGPTEFSSRNRSTQLADQIDKLGGKIERVAFMNSGNGISNAFYSGSGGGGIIRTGGVGGSGAMIGGVPSLLTNKPGSALPGSILGNGGIIKRSNIPSFSGSGGSLAGSGGELNQSAYEKVFAGTPMAGKYSQVVAAAKRNGISPALLASVMAHESGKGKFLSGNNPGGVMDPATGFAKKMQFAGLDDGISKTASVVAKNWNRAGGDITKMGGIYAPVGAANDPNGLNKNWVGGVSKYLGEMGGGSGSGLGASGAGSAGSGDAVGYGRKFLGMNEYTDTKVLAAALGGDVRGKSNAWCARFVNKALGEAGGQGTGSAVANSFQRWGSRVSASEAKRNDVLLETNGKGYNQTGGHVGLHTGETRMHNGKLQLKMLGGNQGDSVSEKWIDADTPGLQVRRGNSGLGANVPQGVTSQVPPASMIQNVPAVPPPSPGIGGGMMRGGFGPAQIHINGSSHDPEALATLVQRRIDESMQWRTHDGDSEYT